MANVKITWSNASMSGATDIDDIRVFRRDGDVLSTYTDGDTSSADSYEIDAAAGATFTSGLTPITTLTWPVSGNISDLAVEHIDTSASDSTSYTYGIFSSNAGGVNIGPGAIAAITT